jgi:hypothetical protein
MAKTTLSLLGAGLAALSAAQAGDLIVVADRVQAHRFDRPLGQIIVANPSVADVNVVAADEILVVGKTPGVTTMTFLDRSGRKVDEFRIRVTTQTSDMLTYHAGAERYTFSCAHRCEQAPALGDGPLTGLQGYIAQVQQRQMIQGMETRFKSTAVEVPAGEEAEAGAPAEGQPES